MTEQQGKDLLQLADYVVANSPRFNWEEWIAKTECDTLCCVAGFLPEVFPDRWTVNDSSFPGGSKRPKLANHPDIVAGKYDNSFDVQGQFAYFFDIPDLHAEAIIRPMRQFLVGLPDLYEDATADQVAEVIRHVVKINQPKDAQ